MATLLAFQLTSGSGSGAFAYPGSTGAGLARHLSGGAGRGRRRSAVQPGHHDFIASGWHGVHQACRQYSAQLTASGGSAPYTWKLVSGSGTLPAGLRLDRPHRSHLGQAPSGRYVLVRRRGVRRPVGLGAPDRGHFVEAVLRHHRIGGLSAEGGRGRRRGNRMPIAGRCRGVGRAVVTAALAGSMSLATLPLVAAPVGAATGHPAPDRPRVRAGAGTRPRRADRSLRSAGRWPHPRPGRRRRLPDRSANLIDGSNYEPDGPGYPDIGLTMDGALALAAAGTAPVALADMVAYVAANGAGWTGYGHLGGIGRIARQGGAAGRGGG